MITDKAKQMLIDFSVTFGSEAGQRILKTLENYCGYNGLCFEKKANVTAFNLGARSVYLFIKNNLEFAKNERLENERQETTDNGN